jgi:hypothetical protein
MAMVTKLRGGQQISFIILKDREDSGQGYFSSNTHGTGVNAERDFGNQRREKGRSHH